MARQQPPFRNGGTVDAAGELRISFRGRTSLPVRITQVSGKVADAFGATCELLLDGAFVCPLTPTGFAAGGEPAIWVDPGGEITAHWTNAPVGSTGEITVFYDYGEA